MITRRAAFVVAAGFAALVAAQPADACIFPVEEVRFFRLEAPVGGLWWVHGLFVEPGVATLRLEDEAGVAVDVDIVSVGLGGSAALRVPNSPVGTRFVVPADLQYVREQFDARLVVGDGPLDEIAEPPPPPSIGIDVRETMVGYESVVVSPIGGECEPAGAAGTWNIHYDERPFLLVADPGDDVVLDVAVQVVDKAPFAPVDAGNEIVFDARRSGDVDTMLLPPPGAEGAFNVHARVRRISDGAVSDVETIEVGLDDVPPEQRWELRGCGCAAGSADPSLLVAFALACARLRIRWTQTA